MSTQTNAPKIFISYSWEPIQNKQKVLELAERLSSNGVHVTLDVWDLEAGHDKYSFMEKMVLDPEIKKVLLICNKQYADKANAKQGGVGTESLIVSAEIYSKADQNKFIPIVFETDNGEACCPVFAKSRIYYDLSSDEIFEDGYEKLLRNIFEKPLLKRPPLGNMPSYLNNEEPIFLPTANKVKAIKNALINEKPNAIFLIKDYLSTFIIALKDLELKDEDFPLDRRDDYDEIVVDRINSLAFLKDDFIEFLNTYLNNSVKINPEILHGFFEELVELSLNNPSEGIPSRFIGNLKGDSWKFLYYELFLVFAAILIQKEKFELLAYIIHTPFIVTNLDRNEVQELSFLEFNRSNSTLNEHRKIRLMSNRLSFVADMIKQRPSKEISFDKLIEADLLLYYISILYPFESQAKPYWFPDLCGYGSPSKVVLPKMVSKRFFEKVKILFRADSKEDLKNRVDIVLYNGKDGMARGFYNIPTISRGLQIDEIGMLS